MSFRISTDGVLALSQGVPQLDGSISASAHDLPVVRGESNGENVLGVANEATSGVARGQIPQTKSSVPGTGQTELTIGGDDDIRDKVRVTIQSALWDTVLAKNEYYYTEYCKINFLHRD